MLPQPCAIEIMEERTQNRSPRFSELQISSPELLEAEASCDILISGFSLQEKVLTAPPFLPLWELSLKEKELEVGGHQHLLYK